MAKKYLDAEKLRQQLFKRTEGYAYSVRKLYVDALEQVIDIVKGTELQPGMPFNFSDYGFEEKVTPIFRKLYSQVYQTIKSGILNEWDISNDNADALVKAVFGKRSIEDGHFAKYFARNKEAVDAFFTRKTADNGLNLSQRVWKYTGMYKSELEDTLELAMGEGTPSMHLSSKIQSYLNDPDRFYRRFRVKIGEDEDGEPIWGYKWKRRRYDPETGLYKWDDEDPRKYHPGQGVYRSSARNAQRLARTETNMAYRTAEYDRWQQLDFVVGIEIKLSNNHPEEDICDDLAGVYPKDFKWTGWHPNCRCYQVPVLASEEEVDEMVDRILDGKDPAGVDCRDTVEEMPEQFKSWIEDNEGRIEDARERGTLPYFIKDNEGLWTGEGAQPHAPTPKDIAVARHAARTAEQIQSIKDAWKFRKETIEVSEDVLGKLDGISDIDLSDLQEALNTADYKHANELAQALQVKVEQLSGLQYVDSPFEVARQFGMQATLGVEQAVSGKLAQWAGLTLEQQEKKLEFEVFKFFDGNMNGVQQKYATWQVSRNAYFKQLGIVQEKIFWKDANLATAEFTSFKTKSKAYDDLLAKLVDSINSKDKTAYEDTVAKLKAKKAELEAAASKRAMKKGQAISGEYKTKFGPEELSQARKDAALWTSDREKVDGICRGETERVWKTASQEEKVAATRYTEGSGGCNRPLRGYKGSWDHFVGIGKVPLDNEGRELDIHALTALIDKCKAPADIWMNRGIESLAGVSNFIGIDQVTLRKMIASGRVGELVGREVTDAGFVSCGTAKGTGFSGTIVNIYAPKGTKMIYAEPFSHFNGDSCSSYSLWDGTGKYDFHREFETIIQRGTKFRITRAYVEYNQLYLDIEVIAQI